MMPSAGLDEGTDIEQLRVDLAAAFRLAVHFDWHESVGNHFSVTTGPAGRKFLMNPKWMHFSRIRPSDLLLLDCDEEPGNVGASPDPTAWAIHGQLHSRLPHVRCLLHLHPPYSTALSCLADPEIKAIDQNTARFYDRVAIDRGYNGFTEGRAEGDRLADVLGDRTIILMGNHGVLVAGPTIAEAFDELYFLERACRTLMIAYASGQAINYLPDDLAKRIAQDWLGYTDMSEAHFGELKTLLNAGDAV